MADDGRYPIKVGETAEIRRIRFRAPGCDPLTAGADSDATTIKNFVGEFTELKLSEGAIRLMDGEKEDSMEKNKTEGYF